MPRSEQQVAAESVMEEAIRALAIAYGFGDDAGLIGDWLCIAEMPQVDPRRCTPYGVFLPGGTLPAHRARGLALLADEAVNEMTRDDDED
jgi:hypothetical protein